MCPNADPERAALDGQQRKCLTAHDEEAAAIA
jgi:hypothetical protein